MKLQTLIADLKLQPPTRAGWQSARVCDLTEDSRTVVPGSLFVARRGLKADGGQIAGTVCGARDIDAIAAGMHALLTDAARARAREGALAAMRPLTPDAMSTRLVALYDELLRTR